MLQQGNPPPDWFMRPAISSMLIDALKNGEPVFTTE
jgi:ATP sulfurylase